MISPISAKLSCSPTVTALDSSLSQALVSFKDLSLEYEQVLIELEGCKNELSKYKASCQSKSCNAAKSLQKEIDEIKALCGVMSTSPPPLENIKASDKSPHHTSKNTPVKMLPSSTECIPRNSIKEEYITPKKEAISAKKSSSVVLIFKEESSSDIDVTPRAKSPVLCLNNKKKGKNTPSVTSLLSSTSSDSTVVREKKKCLDTWPVSQAKRDKIGFPRITTSTSKNKDRKLVQKRFTKDCFYRKPCVVDLTLTRSPVTSGGDLPVNRVIKKEPSDETILALPTSNTVASCVISRPKETFKRPLARHKSDLLESKAEIPNSKDHPIESKEKRRNQIEPKVLGIEPKAHQMKSKVHRMAESSPILSYTIPKHKNFVANELDNSINLLNSKKRIKNPTDVPDSIPLEPIDYDVTLCDTSATDCELSQEIKNGDNKDHTPSASVILGYKSPTKSPLSENKNISNMPTVQAADSSMSLLGGLQDKAVERPPGKRRSSEQVEPVYKEPTVRKKAEKMALPGWLCAECTAFIDALYDDPDPEKISAIVSACSKHRGRRNPARPKTPPGFWETRWQVPTNTEEFNRRNDV